MGVEDIIRICYLIYPAGLVVLFIINIVYFLSTKQTEEDKLFEYNEFKYSYQNVYNRLTLLKKFLNKELTFPFKKLLQYKTNSERTRRPFIKHQDSIENSFILLYASKEKERPVKFLYDRLSKIVKFEVFYSVLFYPFIFIFLLTNIGNEYIIPKIIFGLFFLICIYFFWLTFTKLLLTVKYTVIAVFILIFRLPVGKLRRNMNSLDYLYNTSHFNATMMKLMFVAFITSLGFTSKSGAGTTFKGGKFGGGGAGGSW